MTYHLNPSAISIKAGRRLVLNYDGKCMDVYENKMPVEMKPFWEKIASITKADDESKWIDHESLDENEECSIAYFWLDLEERE